MENLPKVDGGPYILFVTWRDEAMSTALDLMVSASTKTRNSM